MPLLKDLNLNNDLRLLLWKIEETSSFFEERLSSEQVPKDLNNMKSRQRKLELLAARYLWFEVLGFGTVYNKTASGKPVHNDVAVSISHSDDFLAMLIGNNSHMLIGLDVQVFDGKVERIKNKFCSENECLLIGESNFGLTKIWTAKEAVYKMFGLPGVIWKTDMQLIEAFQNSAKLRFNTTLFRAIVEIHWIRFEQFLVAYCKNS